MSDKPNLIVEFSLENIVAAAKQLLAESPSKIIIFNGEMGAGKTTFIKALGAELGVTDTMSSPTFSLVNEYNTKSGEIIYHFDLYRIKQESEALDMGIDEYLYSDNYCFIEWAEKIPNLIPEKHSVVNLSVLSNGNREMKIRI